MKNFRFALAKAAPIMVSYGFIGIASGILLDEAGYGPMWSLASALLIYAGSMQIVLVTLITSGASLWLIAAMTLMINARHIFYGLGFVGKFRHYSGWKYPYMILTLTDEAYSLQCGTRYPADVDEYKAGFWMQLTCHVTWIVGCTLGGILGRALPVDMAGIEFSATAFFVAVVVNQWRQSESHIPAMVGFASALGFFVLLGPDNFLLPALSVSVLALALLQGRNPGGEERV